MFLKNNKKGAFLLCSIDLHNSKMMWFLFKITKNGLGTIIVRKVIIFFLFTVRQRSFISWEHFPNYKGVLS